REILLRRPIAVFIATGSGSGSGIDSRGRSVRVARSSCLCPIAAHPECVSPIASAAMGSLHQPVLVDAVLAGLVPRAGSIVVDGTVGGGGHAVALARRVVPGGRVVGLDRDPAMLTLAGSSVRDLPVTLRQAPYGEMRRVLEELGIDRIQGV